MFPRQFLALISVCGAISLTGCGGGGGGGGGGSFALTDSSGNPISGSRALPSNHGISSSVSGFGAYDQAAFLFTGPTGPTEQPPHGLPGCSYYSIFTVDKTGSLPSQLISPRLPAGNYTLKIYDLKGSGPTRQITLASTSSLTVADSPPSVPAAEVGLLAGGAFAANDSFVPGNDVYVRGSGFQPGQAVDLYVAAHKDSWSAGDSLIDVSGTLPNASPNVPAGTRLAQTTPNAAKTRSLRGTAKPVAADANGRFGPLLAWQSIGAEADQLGFDVILDASRTGRFDPAHDVIVDRATGSFIVDSITRASGGGVTLAYNQALIPTRSFAQLDNVRTKLSSRAVQPTQNHSAEIMVCKHKASWQKGDAIVDASGPDNSPRGDIVPIVNNRLTVPPMYAYHADLLPGDYDIVINPGDSETFDPARDYIDGGNGTPAFTVSGEVPHKKWTVMVYLDGDNSLAPDAITNFKEMESVTYLNSAGKSDVNVVVQYADANAITGRYIVAHSTDPSSITTNPISDLGKVNMADPGQLSRFIAWTKQVSPADHYALILWDHGTGFTSRAARQGPTRNAIWADSFNHQSLSVPQIHDVLKQAGPFDLLACDCCLMGMTEVAYEMRDICSVFNGSEDLEPGHGYDYKAFLSDLVGNPSMPASQLGSSIVSAYKAYYTAHPKSTVTCSCTDESKIAAVSTAIDGVVSALTTVQAGKAGSVMDSFTNRSNILKLSYQMFDSPDHTYADAVDWFTQLKSLNYSADIDAACDAAAAAYSNATIAEYHNPSYSGAHGLTLWLPNQQSYTDSNSEYRDLQFAKDSKWLSFCIRLLSSGSKIDPPTATVSDRGTLTFTASTDVQIPSGSSLAYNWSTVGARGQLSDTKGHRGNGFQSTDNKVLYTPYLGQSGADTVTVDIIIVTGLQRAHLGPAVANVTVTHPPNTTAQAGTLIYTKNNTDGTITLYGFYTFPVAQGAYDYGMSGGSGANILASEIAQGAPVVDRSQDLTAAMAYTTASSVEANIFFNLGGGMVGIYVYPGGFPPARIAPGQEAFFRKSLMDFFTAHPTTVTTYY